MGIEGFIGDVFFTGAAHQKDEISLLSQQTVLAGLAGIGVGVGGFSCGRGNVCNTLCRNVQV